MLFRWKYWFNNHFWHFYIYKKNDIFYLILSLFFFFLLRLFAKCYYYEIMDLIIILCTLIQKIKSIYLRWHYLFFLCPIAMISLPLLCSINIKSKRKFQKIKKKNCILLLLLPGKEPHSLIECICFRLKTLRIVGQQSKFSINYLHLKQSPIYN